MHRSPAMTIDLKIVSGCALKTAIQPGSTSARLTRAVTPSCRRLFAATIRVEPQPSYLLRRRIPSRSRPQKAMRIRAHVAKASNSTIASSIDSLRWCHKSMRAGREIVIIQFPPMSGRNHFPGPTKTSGNKAASTSLLTKQGQPTCNSSSSSFGTSHGAGSSPRSMRGRTANDRAFSRYPRPRQRGHLRRPCAGCLPRRLGLRETASEPNFAARAAGVASVAFVRRRRTVAALCPVEIRGFRIGGPRARFQG